MFRDLKVGTRLAPSFGGVVAAHLPALDAAVAGEQGKGRAVVVADRRRPAERAARLLYPIRLGLRARTRCL